MSSARYVPGWMVGYYDHRCRLFAPDACCGHCGTSDRMALSLRSPRLLCRSCELFRRTGRRTELHHLGGRPSVFVVEVDANDHTWLTIYQYGWRGRLTPGSWEAFLSDLGALLGVWLLRRVLDGASA
jgi:hypothetical protein